MEPDYTPLGARLAERAAPLQRPDVDAQYDYAFGNLCEAMMRMFNDVASLCDPEEPYSPWEPLFDVALCPEFALPWLAQVVGVKLPQSVTGDEAREYIKALSFEQTGKPETIVRVVQSQLTGNKSVTLTERLNGDPYVLGVVTADSDTPDPAAVLDALKASVPAGIIINYRQVIGWIYSQMTTEGGLYSALPSKFTSYQNLSDNTRA